MAHAIDSPPTWADHAHSVLARAGLRRGGARERIIDLLAEEPCALSAVEIEDALRAEGGRIGRASIYRVLELLVEHGLVERVSVGHGLTRFERILPSGGTTTTWSATAAGGWWRSTMPGSSTRSTGCPSGSAFV